MSDADFVERRFTETPYNVLVVHPFSNSIICFADFCDRRH